MVPVEYRRAGEFFVQLLEDAAEATDLMTINQSFTMVQAVFQVFRRRLPVRDAIRFATVLPAGARALFVADWDVDQDVSGFSDRESMTREAKALRAQHNFSPDKAIAGVAVALRKNVDEAAFDAVLAQLPPQAAEFWRVSSP